MRFRCVAQREIAIDAQLEPSLANPREYFAGAPEKLFAIGGVVCERRAGQVDAVLGQAGGIERRHRSARLAEQREETATSDAIEALVECRLADGVVHDVDSF